MWQQKENSNEWNCLQSLNVKKPVTAVAWAPLTTTTTNNNNSSSGSNNYVFAVGAEDGSISLWSGVDTNWSLLFNIPTQYVTLILLLAAVVIALTCCCCVFAMTSVFHVFFLSHSHAFRYCPVETVRRLRWRNKKSATTTNNNNNNVLQLAACATDHSVRIFPLHFTS